MPEGIATVGDSSSPDRSSTMTAPSSSAVSTPVTDKATPSNGRREVITLASDDEDMEVDENIDIVSKPAKKKKEKGSDRLSKDSVKVTPSRDDKASTISHGKSKQAAEGRTDSFSKHSKQPKLESSSAIKGSGSSSSIVTFKNGKLVLKQKKIDFSQQNIALQKRIDWNGYFQNLEEPVEEIPEEHLPLVALLVVESDRAASELAKNVKASLAPPLSVDDEDSLEQSIDRLPVHVVTQAISAVASRVNHGFRESISLGDSSDSDDEPDLPQGYTAVPSGLKLWRWEIREEKMHLLKCLGKDMLNKYRERLEERKSAREEAQKELDAMSPTDRHEVLTRGVKISTDASTKPASSSKASKNSLGKGKAKPTKRESSGDDGGSIKNDDAAPAKKKQKKKELTEEEKAEAEDKLRKKQQEAEDKAQRKAERQAAKAEKEAAKAEKDALKAEKEAAKAAKEAAEQKKLQLTKKQANAFGAFFAKAGTSPVNEIKPTPSYSTPSSSGIRNTADTKSDYATHFKPFFVRNGVEVAPINMFRLKRDKGKQVQEVDEMDIDKEWTVAASLRDFVSQASPSRIPSSAGPQAPIAVLGLMTSIQEAELAGNTSEAARLRAILRNPQKVAMKLLRFKEDVRPAYYGTWTKASPVLKNGRNPFKTDTALLNYDYDSEEEWVEDPEDAEDVDRESNDGDDIGGDSEDEHDMNDGWLAGDDEVEFEEGYDGGLMLDEDDPFSTDPLQQAKKHQKSVVKKRKVTGPLIAVIRGPYFEDEDAKDDRSDDLQDLAKYFKSFKINVLSKLDHPIRPFTLVEKPSRAPVKSAVTNHAVGSPATSAEGAAKPAMLVKKPLLSSEHMPLFEDTVLKSAASLKQKLLEDLYEAFASFRKVSKSVLQRQVEESVEKIRGADGNFIYRVKGSATI